MSVTLVDYQDFIETFDNVQQSAVQSTKTFFDVFGIAGCLLNCEFDRLMSQRLDSDKSNHPRISRKEKKQIAFSRAEDLKQLTRPRKEWFPAHEIAQSAAQGCGSCNVLGQIILLLYSENDQDLSIEHEYSVSRTFALRRRPQGRKEPEEVIQLFQPRGMWPLLNRREELSLPGAKVRFIYFQESNLLYNTNTSIARLRLWMEECLSSHERCLRHSAAQNDSNHPARLLDLSPLQRNGAYGIRLIETVSDTTYRYACLSHRWDDDVESHQTTAANLSKSLDFLNLTELPANFRDAVSIARDLSIQYLWVDSLCIIQCGDDNEDLLRELPKMGSIYQNSYLTIAAVSSRKSSGGCFTKTRRPDVCLKASDHIHETHLIGARILDKKGYAVSVEEVIKHYPLLTRAWVLQEYFLSPRLLQCNYGEFTFECLQSSCCECSSKLPPHQKVVRDWLGDLSFTHRQRLSRTTDGFKRGARLAWKHEAMICWKDIVRKYMQLELSYPADVLPAISGCAQALMLHLNIDYVAGMWQQTLSTDLLWYVSPPGSQAASKQRPANSWAPSWSWASVQMGQNIVFLDCYKSLSTDHIANNLLLRNAIKEVHCEPESASNPFGRMKYGCLSISAMLYPWYLRYFCLAARQQQQHTLRHKRWAIDLHIQRGNIFDECTNEKQGLVIDISSYTLYLDAPLPRKAVAIETFNSCIGDPERRCGLSQIYLLHGLHKMSLSKALDVFLMLERIPPVNGKQNCYQRVGFLMLDRAIGDKQTWDEIVQGRMEPRQEEFWLF
jgi:hypothetical protein